ncbi:GGDEF domain-containing protein [Dyella sp. BiH032]|uniref:GGDEF domain-containing protein n=1 Tax=Dyella sp. BiH032 TaxID=3075430 RepID=UPI00289348E9|nr:GGDEF domain-containing protein [Dyella sp. BiH032]WNL44391.1 GGDEF domain-containing protein [Dyella sp. BiH032]
MPILVAIAFLTCHALALALFPDHAKLLSYLFLIAAPLLAALACAWRSRGDPVAHGWIALALGMLLWTAGMASNMVMAMVLANANPTPGLSMLCYVLYGVPLTYALATSPREAWPVRLIDALLALAVGYLFFVHTFSFATLSNASDEGVERLRLMFDIENVFIAAFAVVRWLAAGGEHRVFFRTLAIFALLYLATAAYINHTQSDVDYGTLADLVIDLPFLTLAAMALRPAAARADAPEAPRRLSLVVRAGSPLMMPLTLLVVSGLILHTHAALATAGFAVALLGYGVRSVLTQVRTLEEQDQLSELTRIDPLTGIANRRQFDETLKRDWAPAARGERGMALLLIDVDHFKQLNDRFGHPAGDACLREVAEVLKECAVRSTDLVARYGGEEFAVILPYTSQHGAERLAETIRAAIERRPLPVAVAEGTSPPASLTVSIGVGYVAELVGRRPEALMGVADGALYEAKRGGRNRVCVRVL